MFAGMSGFCWESKALSILLVLLHWATLGLRNPALPESSQPPYLVFPTLYPLARIRFPVESLRKHFSTFLFQFPTLGQNILVCKNVQPRLSLLAVSLHLLSLSLTVFAIISSKRNSRPTSESDCLIPAVQGHSHLLQHHSSKLITLQCSASYSPISIHDHRKNQKSLIKRILNTNSHLFAFEYAI